MPTSPETLKSGYNLAYRTMSLFSLQKSSANNIEVSEIFTKSLAWDILKAKAIFVNPDEHDYFL